MKFVFETGEVITCNDETIARLLRQDKRYKVKTENKNTDKPKTKSAKNADKDLGENIDKDLGENNV